MLARGHHNTTGIYSMLNLGCVANPRLVATIKTGRVTMSLWLVERCDRSWLWRPVLDLQRAPGLWGDCAVCWFVGRWHGMGTSLDILHVQHIKKQTSTDIPRDQYVKGIVYKLALHRTKMV